MTHVRHGLSEKTVPFVFEGVKNPPAMSLETMLHIWHEAQAQGYVPIHIVEYGAKSEVMDLSNYPNIRSVKTSS